MNAPPDPLRRARETPAASPTRAVRARIALTLALGLVAGLAAQAVGLPLPWMLGPLFSVAGARMLGARLEPLPGGRHAGQWAIGAALGLYFSPLVVAELATHAGLLAGAALAALAFGAACAVLTLRFARVDVPTAFFASLPGGASEMALLADRWGGAADRIAAAHALRIMLVVSVVPFALTFAGAHGTDLYAPLARTVDWTRFPLLVGASIAGIGLFKLLRIANAWVLGPLLGVGLLTALDIPLSALPGWLVNGGQLLIGCSLGCRFAPEFFRAAPRFMAAAALSAALSIALGVALAVALAAWSDVPLATLSLATAPGGVAEMCITAKVLQLGVPLVTACHVLRLAVLTLGAAPAFALFRRVVRED